MVTPGPRVLAVRRAVVDTGSVAAVVMTVLLVCALVSGVVAVLPALQEQALRSSIRDLPLDDTVVEVVSSYATGGAAEQDREVRAALEPLVAPTDGVVIRQTETVAHEQVPGGRSWSFLAVTGSPGAVSAVEGRLPAGFSRTQVEIAVPADAPDAPAPGREITLRSPLDGTRVHAVVVGTWRAAPTGRRALGRQSPSALLVDGADFDRLAARASSVRWRAAPDYDHLEPDRLESTVSAATGVDRKVAEAAETLGGSYRVQNPLTETLRARSRELLAQRMLLLVPALLLLLLGAAGAMLVASALTDNRRDGDTLIRSRGAGRRQVLTPTVLESFVLCAVAALGGPLVAAAAVRVGGVRPVLDPGAWAAGAAAAAVCWGALLLPAVVRAFGGDRGEQLAEERAHRRRLTAILAGVLLVVALGVAAAVRLDGFASAVAEGSGRVDPLLVAAPSLLLLASVALLALGLVPLLFRLTERAVRTRGLVLALGTRSVSRAPGKAVPLALVVALVAGGIAFATVGRASQQDARQARATYEVGADVRVTAPPASRRAGEQPEREELDSLPGVEEVVAVHRELDFVDDVAVEVLSADLAGKVGEDLLVASDDPAQVTSRLRPPGTPGAVPVALTRDLAERAALDLGDRLELTLGDVPVTLEVADTVPGLPTLAEGRAGILVDASALQRAAPEAGTTAPDEWWLAVDRSRVQAVATTLAARPEVAGSVLTRADALQGLSADPGTGGAALADVMTLTAVGSLLIGVVLLCSVLVLRRRERELQGAFLRALGARDHEVAWSTVTEYTLTTGGGVVAGSLAGAVTAAVALRATALGPGGQPLVPTPELHVPWLWTLSLLALLALVPVVALQVLTRVGAQRAGTRSAGRGRP